MAGGNSGSRNLALAGAVFVIPFLLFAGYAGDLADRFSKTRVLRVTKAFEILTMLLAIPALVSGRIDWLLAILFLLAAQANFFSPAKYAILPEMLNETCLTRANGLLELTTFVAIVVGTSFGTLLYERWKAEPVWICLTLVGIAIVGSAASLGIRKTPVASTRKRFRLNPFHEIVEGARVLRRRKPLALAVFGLSWFWFAGALFQMALLLAGTEVLHVSETRVGLLVAALTIGIGAGSVAAGSLSGDYIEPGLVPAGAALMGLSSLAAGMSTQYLFVAFSLVAVGFGGGLFAVPLNAFLQEQAGAAERGRILATNNFANMLGVIAASGALWLMHDLLRFGAGAILAVLGGAMVAASVYLAWRMSEAVLRFALWCTAMLMFRVRLEGLQNIPATGGALLVSNHISYADSVLVGCTTRRRTIHFLMWQPIFDISVANAVFRALRAIPIDGESPRSTLRGLRAARAELMNGELVAIFPEGSISPTGDTRDFERGFEKVLQGTGAPLIPIRIDGLYGHPLSYRNGGPFRSWQRLWRPVVTVTIGQPIQSPVSTDELRQAVLST